VREVGELGGADVDVVGDEHVTGVETDKGSLGGALVECTRIPDGCAARAGGLACGGQGLGRKEHNRQSEEDCDESAKKRWRCAGARTPSLA
jgi:hypothetical protein